MKKLFAIVATVLMLFSLLLIGCKKGSIKPAPYVDIPETPVEEFELSIHDSYIAILRYIGDSKIVKIPKEIEGKPVTIIGNGAFIKADIEMVLLPDSIIEIRERAFQNCKHLCDVQFSNCLVVIEQYAFYNCEVLETVVLPSTLTIIGKYAFADCTSLTEAQIYGDDLIIGEAAFSGNTSLHTLGLQGVKCIGWGAFSKAINLKTVIIPETVEIIDGVAFANCEKLESVTFLGDLPQSIDDYTFKANTIVATLYYKKGATGLDNPALSNYTLKEYE